MPRCVSTSLLLTLTAACGRPGGDDATGAASSTSTTAVTTTDGSPTAETDVSTAAPPTGTGTAGQTADTGTSEQPDGTGETTEQGPPEFDAAWCTKLDPRDVYLAGTYEPAAAYLPALVHPTDPRTSCPGFEFDTRALWIRPGDGRVVWLELFANDAIRVMTPDPPAWTDAMWIYPPDPHANDELIPTPACVQVDPFNDWWGPRELLLHPDGTIVYTCVSDLPQRIYYDQTGAPRFTTKDDRVIAVASDWSLLTVQLAGTAATLRFVPPGGQALAVAGPDPAALVFASRAEGGGFRVALIPPDDGPIERWLITGPALLAGSGMSTACSAQPGCGVNSSITPATHGPVVASTRKTVFTRALPSSSTRSAKRPAPPAAAHTLRRPRSSFAATSEALGPNSEPSTPGEQRVQPRMPSVTSLPLLAGFFAAGSGSPGKRSGTSSRCGSGVTGWQASRHSEASSGRGDTALRCSHAAEVPARSPPSVFLPTAPE